MNNITKTILGKVLRSTVNNSVDADIYVTSYPKSGRTWLRALIGKYLSLRYSLPENNIFSIDFITAKVGLPAMSFSHDGAAMVDKTNYKKLSYDRKKYINKKVIMLGRDIKDTLVSAYFQATKRKNIYKGTISEFIRSEQFGAVKILSFYDIWFQNRHVPESFIFIRYEDLHHKIKKTLKRVLTFIGEISINDSLLDKSIEYCSFENLRKFEVENKFKTDLLKSVNNNDPESYKVRKGKIGGYIKYLSEGDVKFIDKLILDYNFDFLEDTTI